MRNLEQEYKDESGYDVGKIHDMKTTYFSDDYVEWLEKKVKNLNMEDKLLNLHSVSDTYINLKKLRNYFFKHNDLIEDDFREHLTKKILKLDSELKKIESSIGKTYRN